MRINHQAGIIEHLTGNEVAFTLIREHSQYKAHGDVDELQVEMVHPEAGRMLLSFSAQQVFDFLVGAGMEA